MRWGTANWCRRMSVSWAERRSASVVTLMLPAPGVPGPPVCVVGAVPATVLR